MAIKLPSHLCRSRHGTLHFRIVVPADLRQHFTFKEFYTTLDSSHVKIAAADAQLLSSACWQIFNEIRLKCMSDDRNSENPSPIDTAKLMQLIKFARQKYKYEELLKGLDDQLWQERIEHAQRLTHEKRQHDRDLKLVMSVGVTTPPNNILISSAIKDFQREKIAKKKWTPKTEADNLAIYALLVRIIGDKPIADINNDDAVVYLESLQKLPPNINKIAAYVGKSIEEIIAMNPEPMGIRTINKNQERVSSLFKWAGNQPKYHVTHNPFSGGSLDESSIADRMPFTTTELIALFTSKEFTNRQFQNAYAYWLPLLGLFTGARLGELCQLYLADFVLIGGVCCIDLKDEQEGQTLKTNAAKRLVPIHSKLIELGLLRYVEALLNSGEVRLFPELKRGRDGFSSNASKWFGRYKERCGIKEKHTKVFHSFRHTFISSLLDDEVEEAAIAPIVGHEGKLITSRVYWNARDAAKRKPTIEKFQLRDEVWRLIPRFEDVTLVQRRGPHK